MAKKSRRQDERESQPAGVELAKSAESKLEDFAEDLGRLLGHAQNKAESWLGQRKEIAAHLTELRDAANRLLGQLGVEDEPTRARSTPRVGGPGRPRKTARKKRVLSADARARIAAAQRARWAKQKARKD